MLYKSLKISGTLAKYATVNYLEYNADFRLIMFQLLLIITTS